MPPIKRPIKKTVMMSEDENAFHEEVARQLGSDGSAVMRQGLLELGKRIGLTFPLPPKGPHEAPNRPRRAR